MGSKKNMSKKGWDDDSNAVASNWMKFNVPLEDKVFGTLIEKRTMKSTLPGAEGKVVNVYEMKVDEASFHTLDEKKRVVEEPIVLSSGDFISVGGTAVIDRQMQNIRVGQKIGLKYIEEKPSKTKGFAPAKIVKVFAPKNEDGTPQMDEDFIHQQTVEKF